MRPQDSIAAAIATLLFCVASDACAAAQRTFVASSGSDSHPCSLTQPCRSFATAIAQTNAGGEVIVLDSAGYGAVTVTKSVSIISPAGIYAGISVFAGSDGVTINALAAIVVLRGLAINGQGGSIGVNIQSAARVRIESCIVSGMASHGIVDASVGELAVIDTIVRDNGGAGIRLAADASVVVDRVRSEHNASDGLYVANVSSAASATITDSVFAHNALNGIAADGIGSSTAIPDTLSITVDRSTLADNGGDGFRGDSSPSHVVASLTRNVIQHNAFEGIELFTPLVNGILYATVADNAFADNADYGILCTGPHSAILHIARNVFAINRNGSIAQSGACLIYSHQNNEGTGGTSGTIGNAGGF
jgi:hypothetical protein